jgi:hypothetical protein
MKKHEKEIEEEKLLHIPGTLDLTLYPDEKDFGLLERLVRKEKSKVAGASLVFFSGAQRMLLMCSEFQSKPPARRRSNGHHNRASGSIRSTHTRRHFANLTGKSSATARDGNPSHSVTTIPS